MCCSSPSLTTTRKKCNIEGLLINRVAAVRGRTSCALRYAKPPELWTIYYDGYGFSEHSRDFFLYWNGVISRNISPQKTVRKEPLRKECSRYVVKIWPHMPLVGSHHYWANFLIMFVLSIFNSVFSYNIAIL